MNDLIDRRVRQGWLWCFAFLVAACGSSASDTEHGGDAAEEAQAPPEPLGLVPADAFAIVRVDLAQLRASPYWPVFSGWLDDAERAGTEAGQPLESMRALRATLDASEQIVIATVPSGEPDPAPVVIARGSYSEAELRRFVRGPNGTDADVRVRESRGLTVLVGPEISGAQIGTHTWLVAPEPQLEAVLGRWGSGGGPIGSDALRAMAERVGLADAPAAFAIEILPDVRARIARRNRVPGTRGIEQASTIGGRLEIADGLHLVALAEMQSDAAAEQLAAQASSVLDGYAGNVMVRMMGVGPVLDGTSVTAAGTEARLVTRLDDATTRAVFDRLGSFIRLALESVVIEMTTPRAAAEP